jgi:hypothetical protein
MQMWHVACGIIGSIAVQVSDTVDMINSQVMITGFQITGNVIDASSSIHTLNIKDCSLYGQENIIQQKTRGSEILNIDVSYVPPRYTAVDCRTYLENLSINASNALGTTPLISMEAGNLEMTSCNISAQSADTNCLQIRKNALKSTFTNIKFTNGNTGSTLQSLFIMNGNSSSLNYFTNCSFAFSSTNTKTVNVNNGNNSAIFSNGRDDYYRVVNCIFDLQGVSSTNPTNYVILPYYNNSANILLSHSGNISTSGTANKIATTLVTLYPFTAVS